MYTVGFSGNCRCSAPLDRNFDARFPGINRLCRSSKVLEARQLFMITDDIVAQNQKFSEYFAVLSSKTRDRSLLNDAITNLMKDQEFLHRSNSLSMVSEALKNCKVPPHLMFHFWREMYYHGVQIKKQDVKDLLFYCYKFDKRDSNTFNIICLSCSSIQLFLGHIISVSENSLCILIVTDIRKIF